jgi:hypothetical protein
MKRIFIIFTFVLSFCGLNAQNLAPLYHPKDSIRIENILHQGSIQPKATCMPFYFAKQFYGTPYVSGTLEVSPTERLVLNLDGLDCTTFVEVVTSLTLCHQHKQTKFTDFLRWLQKLRYKEGKIDGYPSRNHYFSSWIQNAENQKLVHEINSKDFPSASPFTAQQTLDINFMSQNSNLYPALVKHPEFISRIKQTEKLLTGSQLHFIPKQTLSNTKQIRRVIHNGDILALVTSKEGLDVAHLGFAVWGKDNFLHLLNASSLYHQVLLDPVPIQTYMKKQHSQTGVRVIQILP